MNKITSSKEFIEKISYDEVYNYYILENHPKPECLIYFNTTEKVFRTFLEHYKMKKPKHLVKVLAGITKEKVYGDRNYNNKEKREQTCLSKYGSSSPLSCPKIHAQTILVQKKKYGATGFGLKDKDARIKLAKKANSAM